MLIIPLIILTLCKTNFRIFQVCFVLCLFKALRAAQYALIGQHAQSAVIGQHAHSAVIGQHAHSVVIG